MKLHLTYEFESEDELRSHLALEARSADGSSTVVAEAPVAVAVVAEAPVAVAVVAEAPVEESRSTTDVDGDKMPYDASVHSDPPQFTGDGLWRAKRGKSEEAKSARAAFKARGAAVTAPVIAMPGLAPVAPTLPGMVTLPADAPEPISMDRLIEKITGMFQRGVVAEKTLAEMYVTHGGQADPAAAFGVFNTNESARAGLYTALSQIEPDLK